MDLQRLKLSPGQAMSGITVLNHLKDLGLEPADVSAFASACGALTAEGVDLQTPARAVIALHEAQERTGLSAEELENKVKGLEESASQLKPLVESVAQHQEQVEELEDRKRTLVTETSTLDKHVNMLKDSVRKGEKREAKLQDNITRLEDRLHSADQSLAGARKELKELSSLGISFDDLAGFAERLKGIAHRHGTGSGVLSKRLLQELHESENAIAKAKAELVTLADRNQQLRQEQTSLKTQVTDDWAQVAEEIRGSVALAHNTNVHLKEELHRGIQQDIEEIGRLKTEAIELGMEAGRFQAIVEGNEWVNTLLSLAKGDDGIEVRQVRLIGLYLLRAISTWLDHNCDRDMSVSSLRRTISPAVSELERWAIPTFSRSLDDLRRRSRTLTAAARELDLAMAQCATTLLQRDQVDSLHSLKARITQQLEHIQMSESAAQASSVEGGLIADLVVFAAGIIVAVASGQRSLLSEGGNLVRAASDKGPPFGTVVIAIGKRGLPHDVQVVPVSRLARESNTGEMQVTQSLRGKGCLLVDPDTCGKLVDSIIQKVLDGCMSLPVCIDDLARGL